MRFFAFLFMSTLAQAQVFHSPNDAPQMAAQSSDPIANQVNAALQDHSVFHAESYDEGEMEIRKGIYHYIQQKRETFLQDRRNPFLKINPTDAMTRIHIRMVSPSEARDMMPLSYDHWTIIVNQNAWKGLNQSGKQNEIKMIADDYMFATLSTRPSDLTLGKQQRLLINDVVELITAMNSIVTSMKSILNGTHSMRATMEVLESTTPHDTANIYILHLLRDHHSENSHTEYNEELHWESETK